MKKLHVEFISLCDIAAVQVRHWRPSPITWLRLWFTDYVKERYYAPGGFTSSAFDMDDVIATSVTFVAQQTCRTKVLNRLQMESQSPPNWERHACKTSTRHAELYLACYDFWLACDIARMTWLLPRLHRPRAVQLSSISIRQIWCTAFCQCYAACCTSYCTANLQQTCNLSPANQSVAQQVWLKTNELICCTASCGLSGSRYSKSAANYAVWGSWNWFALQHS